MALRPSDTYNLTTDIGKLRLALNDNDMLKAAAGVKPDGSSYGDEELAVFIELAGSWKRAVSLTLRALANAYAKHATVQTSNDYREDLSKISAQYSEAASQWDEHMNKLALLAAKSETPSVSWADCFGYQEAPRIFGMNQYGARITDAV